MSRLVRPRPSGAKLFSTKPDAPTEDPVKDYAERIVKYVPAEVLAAYLAGLTAITGSTGEHSRTRTVLLAILFIGCLIFTPLYIRKIARPREPKRIQMIVSTLGFLIWSYSIGGWLHELGWYQAGVASLLMIFFTLTSGLIAPTEDTP